MKENNFYSVIDLVPGHINLTGGILTDLSDSQSPVTPDFICGLVHVYLFPVVKDSSRYRFNIWTPTGERECLYAKDPQKEENEILVYHYADGHWEKHSILKGYTMQVGKDAADITSNGKPDIVFAEWREEFDYTIGKVKTSGGVYWAENPDNTYSGDWKTHLITKDTYDVHDIIACDLNKDGKTEVIINNKHGSIEYFYYTDDPRKTWERVTVIDRLPGDGIAVYDISQNGLPDIITNCGFFKNPGPVDAKWEFVSFGLEDLNINPETRIAAGRLNNDASVSVIITESEKPGRAARMFSVTTHDNGKTWEHAVIIDTDKDFRALHSIQLYDMTGNGYPDIITAEMEFSKTDGVTRKPRWYVVENNGDYQFQVKVLLDENIGGHQVCVGKVGDNETVSVIGNAWTANPVNRFNGQNHIIQVEYDKEPEPVTVV